MKRIALAIGCLMVFLAACRPANPTPPPSAADDQAVSPISTPAAPAIAATTKPALPTQAPTRDLTSSTVEFELEIRGDPHPLGTIRGLAVDPHGDLYVVDCSGSRIQKFDSEGNFLTAWGGKGSENGQFELWITEEIPGGDVASGPDGRVFAVDSANSRLQVFDGEGQFLFGWGELGMGEGQFFEPTGVEVGPEGDIYVVDMTRNDVQRFDSEGRYIANGVSPTLGSLSRAQ